jgi:Ni,Fe-hydrogenase III large subunit
VTTQAEREARSACEDDIAIRCREGMPLGAYAGGGDAHYLFLEPGGPLAISFPLESEAGLHSFANTAPLFAWDEREMSDERGVRFADLPDPRPFRAHGGVMPVAVVASGTGLMHMVVGPVHAGIIEPGRFTFSSGGESVVHLDAQLGYGHRGVERALEGERAVGAARRVARICGGCSAARSHAFALALERLAGVTLAFEVELGRLVACELERIYNHLADLAASAAGAGWAPGFANGMALKERAMRACAQATGHRMLFDAIVPGGLGAGVLRAPGELRAALSDLAGDVERYVGGLFGNGSVISRWLHAGAVSHEIARVFGAVGPAHRGSHGVRDVRAFAPYGAYRRLAVQVASHGGGDVFSRCSVKRDELRESFRLVEEALRLLADAAPGSANAALEVVPARGTALAVVEGPRGAETLALHVDGTGRLDRLHAISASYRNWPVVVRAMEGNIVPDFPLVNKSFNLCYACVDR